MSWNLSTCQVDQVGMHDLGVQSCHYLSSSNILITGSWDTKLRFWDLRSAQPVFEKSLSGKIAAMDSLNNFILAITRKSSLNDINPARNFVFDIRNMNTPFLTSDSKLKKQVRCAALFSFGFISGCIAGRVAVDAVNNNTATGIGLQQNSFRSYTFKCHRYTPPNNTACHVYSVNCLARHPTYETLATGGSDGKVSFWDCKSQNCLKHFKKLDDPPTLPIVAADFNLSGELFAYAKSYDWSKGYNNYDYSSPTAIYVHAVKPTSVQCVSSRK
ncbi:mRNA export factor-like [Zophobas morio]|uniref:mRNA export factor-like n=1 Tax=Zophobas morio TaxID=2755281 RepID=UPI003082C23A